MISFFTSFGSFSDKEEVETDDDSVDESLNKSSIAEADWHFR